jgi:hypothetical protein
MPRIERQAQARVPSAGPRCRAGLRSPGSDAAPEQQDCRRLPEIEHLRRPAQKHPGITQVSPEVIGRALRGALEQRLCVQGFPSRR